MAARQQHGFDYQEYVIKQLELKPDKNYIGKNDAYYQEKDGIEYPVQIKFIKKGSAIDLGDYRRNKNKTKDFVLIIGFWEGIKGNITEEYILYPPFEWWTGLFNADDTFDADIYKFLGNISNSVLDDDKWVAGRKRLTKRWHDYWLLCRTEFENNWKEKYSKRLIIPRFKRDHKTQKRIQCAIPNKLFYKHFLRW